MDKIALPTMGEILAEEFMKPLGISPSSLAGSTGLSVTSIEDILDGRAEMTAEMSTHLGRYFGVNDDYFLNLQAMICAKNAPNVSR